LSRCAERLASGLGLGEVPDSMWGHLMKLGLPYQAITSGSADEWQQLTEEARDYWRGGESYGGRFPRGDRHEEAADPPAAGDEYITPKVEEPEKKRAEAYAAYAARQISSYRDVWGFRENIFGGEKLAPEQAYDFLTSPAARCLSPEAIRSTGAPLIGHEAEVVGSEVVGNSPLDPYLRLALRLDPPGDVLTVEYVPREVALSGDKVFQIPLVIDGAENGRVKALGSWPLVYLDRDGMKRTAHPWPGSALMQLRDTAIRVARYLGWDQEHAVWLLLTGEPPYLNPFKVKLTYSRGKPMTVKMEAAAWMPADEVARIFRHIQRKTLTSGSKRLPPRSLEICTFVENHIQDAPERSMWPYLCGKWNAARPGKTYGNWRSFRQVYSRNMPTVAQSYRYPRPSPAALEEGRKATEAFAENLENTIKRGYITKDYDWYGNELTVTGQRPARTPANNGDES